MKHKIIHIYIVVIALFISKITTAQDKPLQILEQSMAKQVLEQSTAKSHKYDYYVLHFKNMETETNTLSSNDDIYLLYSPRGGYPWDDWYRKRVFYFTQECDTMIVCIYENPYTNYYIKDLEFKKGTYYLKSNYYTEFDIKGSDIKTSKYMQNMLFKDYYTDSHAAIPKAEDIFFKDLKFYVIDFSDTINVKLLPISEKEFWDRDFNPY